MNWWLGAVLVGYAYPDKSVAVMFSRSRKTFPEKLVLEGKVLEYQTTVKYLGVTLDKKLR